MKCVSMSRAAFYATLHLLEGPGKQLLPGAVYAAGRGADSFLVGREELCRNGWVELDFDGKILPSPEFARLIYDIAHAEAALRLTQQDTTQWYLLAPTEMLFVEQRKDSFCLERRKGTTLMPWVRENLLPAQEGTLASRRGERSLLTELDADRAGSKFRARELAEHLAVYFGKE